MSIFKINGSRLNKEKSNNSFEFETYSEYKKELETQEIRKNNALIERIEWELIRDKHNFNWSFSIKAFWDIFNILLTVISISLILLDIFNQDEIPIHFLFGFPISAGASFALKLFLHVYENKKHNI